MFNSLKRNSNIFPYLKRVSPSKTHSFILIPTHLCPRGSHLTSPTSPTPPTAPIAPTPQLPLLPPLSPLPLLTPPLVPPSFSATAHTIPTPPTAITPPISARAAPIPPSFSQSLRDSLVNLN